MSVRVFFSERKEEKNVSRTISCMGFYSQHDSGTIKISRVDNSTLIRTLLILVCLSIFNAHSQQSREGDLIQLARLTLEKNPILKSSEIQITSSEGNVRVQQSTFDYQLTSAFALRENKNYLFEADPRNEAFENAFIETHATDFSLGFQRKFRSGLSSALQLNYEQSASNFPFNQFNQNISPFLANHSVTTTLSLTQPLWRGRGRRVVAALERAAKLQVESSQDTYQITTAFELSQMAIAYWQYLCAFKNLSIFEENEKRIRNVLEITEELVKADKKPAGDLVQIQADLANQERQTTVAIQNVYTARLNLGRAIGLSETESESIGQPSNEFPTIVASGFTNEFSKSQMIELAIRNRKDLSASQKTREALEAQYKVATNNLRPQLDLTGFGSYGGSNTGNGLDPALEVLNNREGRNYGVGLRLNFSFPLNNNLAKGNRIQSKAAVEDQEITIDNLKRNMAINVDIAVNDLKNTIFILEKARESLAYSQTVFDNEQVKFQNGLTTLLNLIIFQDRLTLAQRDYLLAQQQFAIAIVNLRFETGTLLPDTTDISSFAIDKNTFYQIPTDTN